MCSEHWVDVEDCALIHLSALVSPDVKGERVFALAGRYNNNSILAEYRKLFPEREFVGSFDDHGEDLTVYKEKERAEGLLKDAGRPGFKSLTDSLREYGKSIS
jgi:hypothetical protein